MQHSLEYVSDRGLVEFLQTFIITEITGSNEEERHGKDSDNRRKFQQVNYREFNVITKWQEKIFIWSKERKYLYKIT